MSIGGEVKRLREIFLFNPSPILLLPFILSVLLSCTTSRYGTEGSRLAVASWYGHDFHGRPTASGERFDMNRFTCAHREFPFGTLLKIINTSNGRSVKCVVNDRGPFVSGRDIDLSYGAAKEIGLIGPGTMPVRVEYLGRDTSYVKEVRYLTSEGPFTIQVGSFKEVENALRLRKALEFRYRDVYITNVVVDDVLYYRVRIGKFIKRDDALGLARSMAQEGYSPVIMKYDDRGKRT